MDNPVIKRRTVSPTTLDGLPGIRLEQCTFKPGEYRLMDASVDRCRSPQGSRISLEGSSQVYDSTMRGDVVLSGESHSSGNTYHGQVYLQGQSTLRRDYLARPYFAVEGSHPIVETSTVTIDDGELQVAPAGDAKPPKKRRLRGAAAYMGANLANSVVYSLSGRRSRRSTDQRGSR